MRLRVALILTAVLAGCGGTTPSPGPVIPTGPAALTLPTPKEAVAAFRVTPESNLDEHTLRKIKDLPGVVVAVEITTGELRVLDPERTTIEVAAVRPLEFRSVAPASTQSADFVWNALVSGEAVVTFQTARRLGLEGASELRTKRRTLTVGAYADNGVPNLVDALVDPGVAKELGVDGKTSLIVGAKPGMELDKVAAALRKMLPRAQVKRLVPEGVEVFAAGASPEPVGRAQGNLIGTMAFKILRGGFIEPDAAWVANNIGTGTVPILGTITCHRVMFPQLSAALAEIERESLADAIDPSDYGGCYVPRFIDRDPRKALSMHAFGLAVDLNVSTNHLGTAGDMHPRVVEIFERWGFAWGGHWNRPDPMHFEIARIIQT